MRSFAMALGLILAQTACDDGIELHRRPSGVSYILDGDMAIPIDQPVPFAVSPGPDFIFLQFDGQQILPGNWHPGNAATGTSFIANQSTYLDPFSASFWVGAHSVVVSQVVNQVRADYAEFDVQIVTERPTSGTYTMIVVGDTAASLGQATTTLGVAPFDASGWNPGDVGFVFSDTVGEAGYGTRQLAHVISHEIAHTLGLEHIVRAGDIMTPAACYCSMTWGSGQVASDMSRTQNDRSLLESALGLALPADPDPNPEVPFPAPTSPGPKFIGSPCQNSSECDLEESNSGECESWFDEDTGSLDGFCTAGCEGYCPEAVAGPRTFCIELGDRGACVAKGGACAAGTALRARRRFVGSSTAPEDWSNVCVPPHEEIACQVGPSKGYCLDTTVSGCAGSILSGACPGPSAIRCCVE